MSGEPLALLVPPPGDDDLSAVARKGDGRGLADAGKGAGHENDLVGHHGDNLRFAACLKRVRATGRPRDMLAGRQGSVA